MNRFLLIGLDGAEPALVTLWMDEGLLPNLRRLRETGDFLPLASTIPPATFPAWTTCATGVNPGKHGIFDFTEMTPGQYALRFVNSTHRKAPAVWSIVSAAGGRVCVLGVPGTYPPEPVNGIMVSGFDSPVCTAVDTSFVHPAGVYEDVAEWRFANFQESNIGPGWHEAALAKMLEAIEVKERIALRLLNREPWSFYMAVFGETDTVAHHFWMFHDPQSPRHTPNGPAGAIRQIYQRLDQTVGKLIAAAQGATVAVVSDHGFGGAGDGVVHINNGLAETGHLHFSAARESVLKKLALTVTPPSWRGKLFRRFPGMAAGVETRSRFGGIDWPKTRAWSEELNYFPSVRINLRGREPMGQVDPAEYDAFCRALCAELEMWPAIRKAWRRDEIYQGDWAKNAPDIVLELALENGYSHSCLRSRGGPAFRRMRPDEFVGGKERGMNGNHRPTGIFFFSKPVTAAAASIEDVAPTILAELGVACPPMDGTPITGVAQDIAPPQQTVGRENAEYSPEQQHVVEERLRALGYLE